MHVTRAEVRRHAGALFGAAVAMAVVGASVLPSPAVASTRVRSSIGLLARPSGAVAQYATARLVGTASPHRSRRTVILEKFYSGHWHDVRAVRTSAGGRYAFTVSTARSGLRTYRVRVARTPWALPATSRSVTLTVQRPLSRTSSSTSPRWTSSDAHGTWSTRGWRVNNNCWSGEAGPQRMYAYSGTHWDVVSNQPALASDRGSVKTYPDTQYDGSPNLLGKSPLSYGTLTSTFSTSTASRGEWNAAYDMWMGNGTEIMVWTSYSRLPSPYDDSIDVPVTFDGVQYYAFRYGTNYVAFQRARSATTGSVNLRAMFQWLVNRGWLGSSVTLEDVEYGFEIHETNGPEKFSLSDFSLTIR